MLTSKQNNIVINNFVRTARSFYQFKCVRVYLFLFVAFRRYFFEIFLIVQFAYPQKTLRSIIAHILIVKLVVLILKTNTGPSRDFSKACI